MPVKAHESAGRIWLDRAVALRLHGNDNDSRFNECGRTMANQKFPSHQAVRSRTSAALSAAISLVLSAAASAADGVDSNVEEVLVTASRVERPLSTIPNTVTVVTTAELDAQLAVRSLQFTTTSRPCSAI
jgi:hypothetical protein